MRTSKRLILLALVVSVTAGLGAVASPSAGEDPRSGPPVLTQLGPEVTLEEMHAMAERIGGERLPAQASQVTVVHSERELTADQLATVVAGEGAEGVGTLGRVRIPPLGSTLGDIGRQIGLSDVILWGCYWVIVIIGDSAFLVWVCQIVII